MSSSSLGSPVVRPSFLITVLVVILGLGACSDGDDPTQPGPTTGALAIDVDGLATGMVYRIGVTGPDLFSATGTGDTTLTGLAPGTY